MRDKYVTVIVSPRISAAQRLKIRAEWRRMHAGPFPCHVAILSSIAAGQCAGCGAQSQSGLCGYCGRQQEQQP